MSNGGYVAGEEPLLDRIMDAYRRMTTPRPELQAATASPLMGFPAAAIGADPAIRGGPLRAIPTPTIAGGPALNPPTPMDSGIPLGSVTEGGWELSPRPSPVKVIGAPLQSVPPIPGVPTPIAPPPTPIVAPAPLIPVSASSGIVPGPPMANVEAGPKPLVSPVDGRDLLYSGKLGSMQALDELAKIQKTDPGLMGRTVEEQAKIRDIVSSNPWLATLVEHQIRPGGAGGGDESYHPEWYNGDQIAPGVNPALHGGRMLEWLQQKAANPEEQLKEIAQRYNANPKLPGAFPETMNPSWGQSPSAGIPTPAGPASVGIRTLRGGRPGLAVSYSPEQTAAQQGAGINLVGTPFEWDASNVAQLDAALARRAQAMDLSQYHRDIGQASLGQARAAETGKLALYDPNRIEAEKLLEAGKQNPQLWMDPAFKQKVGVPLTLADKAAMLQQENPGVDIASGLNQLKVGQTPGSTFLSRLSEPGAFSLEGFGKPPLSPRQKTERALSVMSPEQAALWRRVAEVMGLLNPVTGAPAR